MSQPEVDVSPEANDTPGPELADVLIEREVATASEIEYARRVCAKLNRSRPLIDVLCELGIAEKEELLGTLRDAPIDLPLEQLLLELGFLDPDELQQALDIQAEAPDRKEGIGDILLEHGYVDAQELLTALSLKFGRPTCSTLDASIDHELIASAPSAWSRQHGFVPVRREGGRTVVAFSDPSNAQSIEAAGQVYGVGGFDVVLATASEIDAAWRRWERSNAPKTAEVADEEVVGEVDTILADALKREASDIHIEPLSDRLRIRFREDGVLVPYRDLPIKAASPLTSRLKILSQSDIAERRRHQGGRFSVRVAGVDLDMRASFYVTVHGQKTVLRLLNRARTLMPLKDIGMPKRTLERYCSEVLERPSGVVLVTGPTGSGKTSTLYSSIHHINHDGLSIVTAEDPVEYTIEGISQCSINAEIDLTYEETLRHIVRQDPDVVVIGEIRDKFSAETAIQAALTGHKVITTFHTEDTIGGLVRLLNMNIEAFLISSTVVSVLAQRLVRKVCERCAVPYEPTAADHRMLGVGPEHLKGAEMRIGRGCSHCRGSGYRGRVAVFELLVLTEEIRDAILAHATAYEIRRISRERSDLVSLFEDGLVKAANGVTTLAEIHRMLPRLDVPRPLQELRRMVGD